VPATIDAEAAKQAWGRNLASARVAAGRSQDGVAAATDLDQRTVSRAERGIGRFETFIAIANELDVTLFEVST
jgi:transcriptional regulator with XRE-family HTH domain